MKSGDNNLDAHRETKTVRDLLSPYHPDWNVRNPPNPQAQ